MSKRAPSFGLSLVTWVLLLSSCGGAASFRYDGEGVFTDRGRRSVFPRYRVTLGTLHLDGPEASARFWVGVLPDASYDFRLRLLEAEASPVGSDELVTLLGELRRNDTEFAITIRRGRPGELEYVGRSGDALGYASSGTEFFLQDLELTGLEFCAGEAIDIEVTVARWPPGVEADLEVLLVGGGKRL